ncbi:MULTISPECIES: hypothetical protein [Bradyrhizobium]|uniref:hypothetical protein n=1 Tax=Bradyrhizobium TaxID=374 RepID=UPI0014857835|nr:MULTISPECIES: hypothetical protein [Bradyrhizobium]
MPAADRDPIALDVVLFCVISLHVRGEPAGDLGRDFQRLSVDRHGIGMKLRQRRQA